MKYFCRYWLPFLLGQLASLPRCHSAQFVTLTDETFEHQTQASTGQTTGKWLVMMSPASCVRACNAMANILEGLSSTLGDDDDSNIITSRLDTQSSPITAERFEVVDHPTLIYFANRRMYRYYGETTLDDIKAFVTTDYVEQKGEPVPAPLGPLQVQLVRLKKSIADYLLNNPSAIPLIENITIFLCIGGVLLFIIFICFGGKKKMKTN